MQVAIQTDNLSMPRFVYSFKFSTFFKISILIKYTKIKTRETHNSRSINLFFFFYSFLQPLAINWFWSLEPGRAILAFSAGKWEKGQPRTENL